MLLPYEQALTLRSEFPRIARILEDTEDFAGALARLTSLSNVYVAVTFVGRAVTVELSGWATEFKISVGHADDEDPTWALARCLTLLAERAANPRLAVISDPLAVKATDER